MHQLVYICPNYNLKWHVMGNYNIYLPPTLVETNHIETTTLCMPIYAAKYANSIDVSTL